MPHPFGSLIRRMNLPVRADLKCPYRECGGTSVQPAVLEYGGGMRPCQQCLGCGSFWVVGAERK